MQKPDRTSVLLHQEHLANLAIVEIPVGSATGLFSSLRVRTHGVKKGPRTHKFESKYWVLSQN